MEEARQLLQGNNRKFMALISKPVLNEAQPEEGSCSNVVNQIEPRRVWRNNTE